jgi:lysophospholipase L1-like esterase
MKNPPCFPRYVAIGDSSTEGLEDPDGRGGYRGWANRLADHLLAVQGSLLYANLAVRGRNTRQIRDQQLATAAAMRPDLATLFAGTNDAVSRQFDAGAFADDLELMQATLIAGGATVLSFTLPDLTSVMPMARRLTPRVRAMNQAIRDVSARTGALVVDFAAHPVAGDPRLWHPDRLHANAAGHARIAAALAHALGLPGADAAWAEPLPPAPDRSRRQRLAAELDWGRRYLLPWLWRHARGRSSGDDRHPKRPLLAPWPGSPSMPTR